MKYLISLFTSYVLIFLFPIGLQAFTLISTNPNQQGWAGKTVSFALNPSGCPGNINSILTDAVNLWNSVPWSGLKVEIAGSSSASAAQAFGGSASEAAVIVCDTNFGATTGANANNVAGVGLVFGTLMPIVKGSLLLNAQAGANASIANMSSSEAAVIAAHEIGHVLGFGHSADEKALMYYDASYRSNLALGQDDMDAISYLYPRDELSGQQIMGCGTVLTTRGKPPGPVNIILYLFLLSLPFVLWGRLNQQIRRSLKI